MKRQLALSLFLLGLALMLIRFTILLTASASDSRSRAVALVLARLGDRVTVHAQGQGSPTINFADGREALTAYAGDPEAQRLLHQNLVQPLAMASADFDEDGVPDLVSGYAAPNGGMLTLHRGNVDAIYPHTLEAQQRNADGTFTDAPFLSPARAFETPRPVDFIGCGDFDADGHYDAVTAASGGSTLYFFLGDGRGNLNAPRQVAVPGRVTAMVTGEINRADGLTDIVVGVAGEDGPKALVFEAPDGALRANPEVFPLPAEASALALGQFDDDFPMDLAVASGRELMIVRGQAQRPSLNKTKRAKTRETVIDRRSFSFAIRSLAIGDFNGNQRDDVALLSDDGAVHVLSRPEAVSTRRGQKSVRLQEWQDKTLPGAWPQARLLDRVRVSSLPADNLILIDSTNKRLHILANTPSPRHGIQASATSASLDVEGEPVAVLPMRLNADALSDLVILRRGQVAPTVTITTSMTFTVIDTGDNGGVDPSPGADTGTLRQAIVDANANAGSDTITFSIGSGAQTINLITALPDITGPVTIDGTTQPGFAGNPIIELSGSVVPSGDGLVVSGGGTTIRGLVINRFPGDGIFIQVSGNNIIERNFIGTNITGNASAANAGSGVLVDATNDNRIGGTTAAAGNLISGNSGAGVEIINDGAVDNLVQGNFIGTNAAGTAALGNGNFGVALLVLVSNNTIGGATPGARNLISANSNSGVVLFGNSQGNLVQGNLIGANAAGTAALPNIAGGVIIDNASNNTVGGTVAAAGNTIAFNLGIGVDVVVGSGNAVLGNSIFSNNLLGIDLDLDDGVTPNDACDGDLGPNNLQNFPVLTSASSSPGNTTIVGTLNSASATTFRIEFFSNAACDPSGNGEGQTFIGATAVSTPAGACIAPFNVNFPITVPGGSVITATATDPSNNTSEFSQCVTVTAQGPVSDLQITKSDSPDPVLTGSNITYTIAITNNGPDTDGGATFTDIVPAGTTFVSLSSPGSCSTPSVGGTGSVTCSLGGLGSGGRSVAITLVVNVNAAPGATITNTAMVSGMSADPNLTNNSATASTAVMSSLCTLTCPPTQMKSNDPNRCGAGVTYPLPTTSGPCGTVTCAPASGAFFPKGTTEVTCNTGAGPSCVFNVTVNDTQPPTITCPPNQTVTGTIPTLVNYPPPTAADNCPGVSTACNPASGSTFPVGTTTVTCTATDTSAKIASCTFTVTVATCTITCPADLFVSTSPTATLCGTVVTYSPVISGACGTVNCAPPSGSFFNVGTATVTCTTSAGPSCSFSVTVVDATLPRISCSTGVTAPLPAGQLSAVVNYPAPTATDNCSGVSVVCAPPSGSTFPAGATLVTCTATDASENADRCSFFVTLLDAEPPVIRCPANVNAGLPPGQTSAVVNYPPPTVTDNLPGVNVVCLPASGSSFAAGTTTVTCTATDAAGNKSSCSFIVGVGGPQVKVTIPGNNTAVAFAADPTRKPPKPKKNPCGFFTVENIGFAPLVLTFDSIARTGGSVDSGRITDPNDTRFFSLSLANSDQSLTPLDIGAVLTLQPGQVQNLCAKFAALIPALAGKTTGLAASNVLPDAVTSRIVFRQNAGANIAIPLSARVSTGLVLVNLSNPRTPAEVLFTKSGNDITVSYAVFDSNLDVSRAKYEFLNSSGQVVAGPFEIDLAPSISSANLVRGQSFSVDQKFTGASSNPEITGVRLTVFDGETSVGTASAASISAAGIQLMNRARRVTLYPPDVKLR